jgi:hypothetical protein
VRYRVDASTGGLSLLGHTPCGGLTPRNFAIDPSGNWLLCANQGSGSVTVFAVDQQSGHLTRTGEQLDGLHSPLCIQFVRATPPSPLAKPPEQDAARLRVIFLDCDGVLANARSQLMDFDDDDPSLYHDPVGVPPP